MGGTATLGTAGMGGATGMANAGAAGAGGGGAGGGAGAAADPGAIMMRVNSPGSELGGGAGTGGSGATGVARSCDSRSMSRVTLPCSSAGFGGAYDGSGSGRYGAGSCARGADDPGPASEERMLVTLDEEPSLAFSAGRKNGSFFHESSAAAGGAGRAGVGAGAGGGACLDGLLKIWVKPPSAEADPDAPGEENPFAREGPGEGGVGPGVSSEDRDGVDGRAFSETKMRVNSPAPWSGACRGPGNTCVVTCGEAPLAGAAGGPGFSELNSFVNSPCPAPAPAPAPGAGTAACAGRSGPRATGGAGGAPAFGPNGSAGFFSAS